MVEKAKEWGPAQDEALLNEIDDLIRKKMRDLEQAGGTRDEIVVVADRYARIFDLIDARLAGLEDGETSTFIEQAFIFLEEGLYEKLELIYDPGRDISKAQASEFVLQMRQKIRRIEQVLFKRG